MKKTEKRVICKSGRVGWQDTLHNTFNNDFEEFKAYCEIYNNHIRLGYRTPESAWKKNPTVQGSTNPSDYRKIIVKKKQSLFDRENEFPVEDFEL